MNRTGSYRKKTQRGGVVMGDITGLLYLEVNLAALIIMVIVLIKSVGFSRMASQKKFILALSTQIAFALADTLFTAFCHRVLPFNGPAVMLFKSLHMLLSVAMVYTWFLYFEGLQGRSFLQERTTVVLSSAVIWVVAYALISNLFHQTLFYIDEAGEYRRGSWYFVVQMLLPAVYIYASCDRTIRNAFANRHTPEGRIYIFYTLFPIVLAITGYLQYRFPEFPLVNISMALATLVLYVNSMDEAVSIDPLTQLFNRRQFMRTMSLWFSARNEAVPMYFMIMDVDKFKLINDRFGHTEGDTALVRVADTLRDACSKQRKKVVLARYGGDEFMILVEAAGEDEVKKLITQIERTLREKNSEAAAPYRMSLSIGYARLDEAKTIKAVIDMADERQYEVKKIHHRIIEGEMAAEASENASNNE